VAGESPEGMKTEKITREASPNAVVKKKLGTAQPLIPLKRQSRVNMARIMTPSLLSYSMVRMRFELICGSN
jgi:hypothetical protein